MASWNTHLKLNCLLVGNEYKKHDLPINRCSAQENEQMKSLVIGVRRNIDPNYSGQSLNKCTTGVKIQATDMKRASFLLRFRSRLSSAICSERLTYLALYIISL
jgi:hypothetical protein